ncbi:MAG: serine/threonine-protein kinase, partial [Terracidiphilus sp.]
MKDGTQQRVRELFAAAAEVPAAERKAWLRRQTAGQDELYEKVARLLDASQSSGGFLAEPAFQRPAPPAVEGTTIGAYRVLRELGSGGMGIVYLTVRSDNVYNRLAALKVIRPELRSDPLVRRFLAERQILARLDHPNIARIVDGGETPDGLPYFVMDYVDGQPIDQFCAARQATLEERLELIRQTCAAVEYLHANNVIHRDLKPANLLVTEAGVVKLLDFGIARHVATATGETTGLPLLTPGYASPEQLLSRTLTPAADIYSVGAVLYELLTGARPLRLEGLTLPEMLKTVAESEPCPPSQARATMPAAGQAADSALEELRPRLAGDLDAIVLMALRKQPERRYPSPAALAADLDRFRRGLPVVARRDSKLYFIARTLRRNALRIAAGLLVAASLGVGGVSTWRAMHYRQQIQSVRADVETLRNRYAPAAGQAAGSVAPEAKKRVPPPAQLSPTQLSEDLNGLARKLQAAPPEALSGPLAPTEMSTDLVHEALDLFARVAPEAMHDPETAAALGRAYLAVSRLQWNPDGKSLDQPAGAA